jgi:hypothetical protein
MTLGSNKEAIALLDKFVTELVAASSSQPVNASTPQPDLAANRRNAAAALRNLGAGSA